MFLSPKLIIKLRSVIAIIAVGTPSNYLDIVGTVYHFVIYMQSNKIHKVF